MYPFILTVDKFLLTQIFIRNVMYDMFFFFCCEIPNRLAPLLLLFMITLAVWATVVTVWSWARHGFCLDAEKLASTCPEIYEYLRIETKLLGIYLPSTSISILLESFRYDHDRNVLCLQRHSQWTDFEQLHFLKHANPSHMTKLEMTGGTLKHC